MSRDAYSLLHYTSLPSVRLHCCVDVVLKLHILHRTHRVDFIIHLWGPLVYYAVARHYLGLVDLVIIIIESVGLVVRRQWSEAGLVSVRLSDVAEMVQDDWCTLAGLGLGLGLVPLVSWVGCPATVERVGSGECATERRG